MSYRPTFVSTIDAIFFGEGEERTRKGRDELIVEGWLRDESPVGFGALAGSALGISAERHSVAWVIAGPEGIRARGRVPIPLSRITADEDQKLATPEQFLQVLTDTLKVAQAECPDARLGGAAIAWPAAIALDGEPTHYENRHPDFAKTDFSLRRVVADAVIAAGFVPAAAEDAGPHIAVINDADADLLYEARWGVARTVRHAILVKLCGGVGSAVLVDGRVLRGHSGRVGEIEHTPVRFEEVKTKEKWDGVKELNDLPACGCKLHSCIERFASGRAIIDSFDNYQAPDYNARGRLIEEHAAEKHVRAAFERAGSLLGLALTGPVLALDPECVIITAYPANGALIEGLRANLPDPRFGVVGATPGGWTTAGGAARLVVEQDIVPRLERAVLSNASRGMRRGHLPAWLRHLVSNRDATLLDMAERYSPDADRRPAPTNPSPAG